MGFKGKRGEVYKLLKECLKERNGSARYSEIVKCIKEKAPHIKESTIHGSLHVIRTRIDNGDIDEIEHPGKGIFKLKVYSQTVQVSKYKEEDFYPSLASFLVNDLEECTKAIVLGKNYFRDKWGTPDVIGIYKFPDYLPMKPPPEIVSCELKLDGNQLVVAFGQACSYKIFSHKVYLVVPKSSDEEERSRIESLCLRFGIGLVLFDPTDINDPKYEIRNRAIKSEPDYYYLNKYINRLDESKKKELFS